MVAKSDVVHREHIRPELKLVGIGRTGSWPELNLAIVSHPGLDVEGVSAVVEAVVIQDEGKNHRDLVVNLRAHHRKFCGAGHVWRRVHLNPHGGLDVHIEGVKSVALASHTALGELLSSDYGSYDDFVMCL